MAYQTNDTVATLEELTIGLGGNVYHIPLDTEGAVVSESPSQVIVRFALNGQDVELPVWPQRVKLSDKAARTADLAELLSTKAAAALTANGNAKTAVANALSAWSTATNAQKLDMIQTVLQVQQGMLNREEKIIKILRRLIS
jgi:hypothetical protein